MALAKRQNDAVTLVASAAQTATSTGEPAVRLPTIDNLTAVAFTLDVTAAATETADTLNLQVQTMLDGVNWTDVVWFTEVLGDGGALRWIEKITVDAAESGFKTGTALAAGAVRNLFGDQWRVAWQVVDSAGDNASFTFSVTAQPM